MGTPHLLYSLVDEHLGFLDFGYYESCCYTHSYASLCIDIGVHFFLAKYLGIECTSCLVKQMWHLKVWRNVF